jgi:large subunit ribosomal protein L4
VEIAVIKLDGSKDAPLEVAESVFAQEFRESLIHQVVTAYLAGGRSGSSSQKNRSDVRGGGAKPWRQKGTGKARAGTIRSPIWRGGGRAFPAASRSYAQKVNRKMYRVAVRSIWSELARQERLKVCDEIKLDMPKTGSLSKMLIGLDVPGRVLIVTEKYSENLNLAARNIKDVQVREVSSLDPVTLVASETVLLSSGSLREIERSLQ